MEEYKCAVLQCVFNKTLIKGHFLRKAGQTTLNKQNSKPRPPIANAKRKVKNLNLNLHITITDHLPPLIPVQG